MIRVPKLTTSPDRITVVGSDDRNGGVRLNAVMTDVLVAGLDQRQSEVDLGWNNTPPIPQRCWYGPATPTPNFVQHHSDCGILCVYRLSS